MNRFSICSCSLLFATVLFSCRNQTGSQPGESPEIVREGSQGTADSSGSIENLFNDSENRDRNIWQKPEMVISMLGDLNGKTVADIGAGSGYFAFRLTPKAEKVIGIDIDPGFISFLDSMKVRLPESYRDRFESRLAQPDDPMLRPGEAHAVIIVNTYAYIDNRTQYLKTLYKGIAPRGRLLIVDFKKNDIPVGPPDHFRITLNDVRRELVSAGFKVVQVDLESLDYQYIIIAEKE
jgi:ubiquinone/menaquinone biosynthesis C-methylase UbiE